MAGPRRPREVHVVGLSRISERTLQMHIGLYRGYLKSPHLLTEQLAEMRQRGRIA